MRLTLQSKSVAQTSDAGGEPSGSRIERRWLSVEAVAETLEP
jgi:hypothetical protein